MNPLFLFRLVGVAAAHGAAAHGAAAAGGAPNLACAEGFCLLAGPGHTELNLLQLSPGLVVNRTAGDGVKEGPGVMGEGDGARDDLAGGDRAGVLDDVRYDLIDQEVLRAHNRLRKNPRHFIRMVEEDLKYFEGIELRKPGQTILLTKEGKPAWEEALRELQKLDEQNIFKGQPNMTMDENMRKAARDHTRDLGSNGGIGHTGKDGSRPSDRISRYCDWKDESGENLSFGPFADGDQIVLQLFIDDGEPGRGHRANLLNPKFKVLGASCGKHKGYSHMCCIDYAGGVGPKGSGNTGEATKAAIEHDLQAALHGPPKHTPPEGFTKCSTRVNVQQKGDERTTTTIRVYTMQDGSKKEFKDVDVAKVA